LDEIKKFREFFETEEGDKCFARLLRHAGNLLRFYQWGTRRNQDLSPEDIVIETIERVLDGRRKWNSEKHFDIEKFLKLNIRSVIDHSFDNVDDIKTHRYPEDCEGNTYIPFPEDSEINEYSESLQIPTPEELFFSEIELTEFNAIMLAHFVEHPDLEELAYCLMDNLSKPQEIAKELSITISEVNNRKKRLKRELRKIYPKP
jgi:DNA-directed RNA polymerase specialized sigma24 family protein